MIKLVNLDGIKAYRKLPKKVQIGEDCEGFFKKLDLEEFFAIQERLLAIESDFPVLSEDESKDATKTIERTKQIISATKSLVVDLMVEVMTDDKGESAFSESDKEGLSSYVTPNFANDFLGALMKAQGITKEELAKAEDSFRK